MLEEALPTGNGVYIFEIMSLMPYSLAMIFSAPSNSRTGNCRGRPLMVMLLYDSTNSDHFPAGSVLGTLWSLDPLPAPVAGGVGTAACPAGWGGTLATDLAQEDLASDQARRSTAFTMGFSDSVTCTRSVPDVNPFIRGSHTCRMKASSLAATRAKVPTVFKPRSSKYRRTSSPAATSVKISSSGEKVRAPSQGLRNFNCSLFDFSLAPFNLQFTPGFKSPTRLKLRWGFWSSKSHPKGVLSGRPYMRKNTFWEALEFSETGAIPVAVKEASSPFTTQIGTCEILGDSKWKYFGVPAELQRYKLTYNLTYNWLS